MSEKYYAVQRDPELFNPDMWYSEDDAVSENIWIGGNRNYTTFNSALVDDVLVSLYNVNDILERILDVDEIDNASKLERIVEIIKYHFKKKDGSNLTNRELKILFTCSSNYGSTPEGSKAETDLICQVLEVLYGESFNFTSLHGYSQSDWQNCIYPASMSPEHIKYIESVYFNTGSTWMVLDEYAYDQKLYDDMDAWVYSQESQPDKIKVDIIKQLSRYRWAIRLSPSNLILEYNDGTIVESLTEAVSQRCITLTKELERLLINPRYKNYASVNIDAANQDTIELTIVNKTKYDKILDDVLKFLNARGYKNAKVVSSKDFGMTSVKVNIELNLMNKEDQEDETDQKELDQNFDKKYMDKANKTAETVINNEAEDSDIRPDLQAEIDAILQNLWA